MLQFRSALWSLRPQVKAQAKSTLAELQASLQQEELKAAVLQAESSAQAVYRSG